MVINNKKFNGFSLLEAVVVMLIVSIFVAMVANVIPKKAKKKVASEAHGRFECYYGADGVLYQQTFTEHSTTGVKKATEVGGTATSCVFQTPYYAKYVIIDAVGGGAGGGTGVTGGEGKFTSVFYTSISKSYTITPGLGGAYNTDGAPTVIDTGNGKVTARGGSARASILNTETSDIQSCVVTEYNKSSLYDCKTTPECSVEGDKIKVSFCRSKENYRTVYLTYKATDSDGNVITNNPRYIVNDITLDTYEEGSYTKKKITKQKSPGSNTWLYYDSSLFTDYDSETTNPIPSNWTRAVDDKWTPSLYKMEITFKSPASVDEAPISNLERYIKSMGYTSDISKVSPGKGGANFGSGKAGAAILLW